MPLQDRDYMKTPEPPSRADWLARLNAFGERHSKPIITACVVLAIFLALFFAKRYYDETNIERAEKDLAEARTEEQLQELLQRYGHYPVAARILYRLGNRYQEGGRFDAARQQYQEFQSRFPGHPITPMVMDALIALEKNLKFQTEQKEIRLREHTLRTHPSQMADLKDSTLQWGPLSDPKPVVEIETAGGTVKAELYEDDAPNAVADFVKLCDRKYFDGLAFELVNIGERIQTPAKAEGAVEYALAAEVSRPAEEGSLVLIRREGAEGNVAGRFQVLLKSVPALKDATVFGAVTEGLPLLKGLKAGDALKSVKVVSRRSHPYEPQVVPPAPK